MKLIKAMLYVFIITVMFSACFINKDRGNSNDPKAGNYTSPTMNIKQDSVDITSGSAFDFGYVHLDSTKEVSFTIENNGNAVLHLSGNPLVQVDGIDASMFSVSELPDAVINVGGSSTFSIQYVPATVGNKSASILINNDDVKNNPYTISLTGNVTAWKISSWTDAAPVFENYTHENDNPNGFPQFLAIADNDKLHVLSYLVEPQPNDGFIYSIKEPDDDIFYQSPISFIPIRPDSVLYGLHVALASNDRPLIAYSNNDDLCFMQNDGIFDDWSSPESLYTTTGVDQVYVFLLASDTLDPRIFYLSDNTIFETLRTGWETIEPYPPSTFLTNVGTTSIVKYGTDDLVFIYSDLSGQKIYYRTLRDATVTEIWSTTDPNTSIGLINAALDSNDDIHVCFTTMNPSDFFNPEYYSLRYVSNSEGPWEEKASIEGDDSAGPFYLTPSIAITQDNIGNDHLHLVYTVYQLPGEFQVWYAYFENDTLIAENQLDPYHTSSFWTVASIVADSQGDLHVVYSWAPNELNRTLMYLKGISAGSN